MGALVADGSGRDDVLVAPATGFGALAIVRLTGPPGATLRVARRLAPGLPEKPPARQALVRRFVDANGRPLDEGVVLLFAAPRSVTGEEVVELQCHGSRSVVGALVAAACAAGARRARPGEFTRRALANGRLDLARAEGVAGMTAAESRGEAARALGLFDGALSREVRRLREALLDILAEVEAGLDFAEDVPLAEPAVLRARIAGFVREVEALSTAPLVRPGAGAPAVAILGRPNAGKSTLFNRLLGEDRAIVTEHPGTTRDVLAEGVEIGGERVVLLDTAGLRRGAEAVEEIGIARAYEAARGAALLLYVVDGSVGTCAEDREALARLEAPTLLVRTKADLPAAADPELAGALAVSARTGEGLAALADVVARTLGAGGGGEDPVALLARHRDALRRTREEAAAAASLLGDGEEYGAAALRRALHALGEITGESATEDLLDRIFSGFCIGK